MIRDSWKIPINGINKPALYVAIMENLSSLRVRLFITQTHVDPGITRGMAKVAGRQNAPLRDAAEVCVSADTTSRCVQVYLPAGSGEQSMEASRSRQHT